MWHWNSQRKKLSKVQLIRLRIHLSKERDSNLIKVTKLNDDIGTIIMNNPARRNVLSTKWWRR
jgi:hypothetical protein